MEKIGHRGAKAHIDENTLESIKKAIELNVTAVKIDVHCCKTGELIVIHDEKINRTTNKKGTISKLEYNEINEAHTINKYAIPTLEQVLDFCKGKCKIHIELKGKGTAQKTCKLITDKVENSDWNYDQLIVSSSKLSRLKKIKSENPNILLGLVAQKRLSLNLDLAIKNKLFAFYPYYEKLKNSVVKSAHKKGIKLFSWTVNKKINITRMQSLKVNGIISDYPEKL